jgi:protein SCO1/2
MGLSKALRVAGVCSLALGAACSTAPETREYELTGQVLAVRPERREVVIKHQDIVGFMPAMTMPFTVRDDDLLGRAAPGDLVEATLVFGGTTAYLSRLSVVGRAPLADAVPTTPEPDVLVAGEGVADAVLVDQDGRAVTFGSYIGHRVALTFIYTRCPLPDFCPLMDLHFAAIQKTIAGTPALADVRLVTVTLDPAFDRPEILAPYARRRGADPAVWSFLTGEPTEVGRFASQFGLYVEHNPDNPIDITHNLRTVVIDPEGRLVVAHSGNTWTPSELVASLTAIPAARH